MANSGFEILRTSTSLDLWLDRRLPFEPKGDVLLARNELRAGIRSLECGDKEVLVATYTSLDADSCDAENVLLYNVGMSSFTKAMRRGVQFERRNVAPPIAPTGRPFRHHHGYRFVDAGDLLVPKQNYTLTFPLDHIRSSTKPHHIWWAASARLPSLVEPISGPFELHIQIPASAIGTNLAIVVKPLIDGIICALHHDSDETDEAVQRLATATSWDAVEIRNRLFAGGKSILGERRVLWTYRDFVKWNPADDLCHRCTILLHHDESRDCIVSVGALSSTSNDRNRIISDVAQGRIDFAAGNFKAMTAQEIVREALSENERGLPII